MPRALRAEHDHDAAAASRRPCRRVGAPACGAVHPGARLLGLAEVVGEVAHPGHRQVLDGARRTRGTPPASPPRRGARARTTRSPRRTRRCGRRPQVLRVLDLVQRHHQRVLGLQQPPRRRRTGTAPPRTPGPGGARSRTAARAPAAPTTCHGLAAHRERGPPPRAPRRPPIRAAPAAARAAPRGRRSRRRGSLRRDQHRPLGRVAHLPAPRPAARRGPRRPGRSRRTARASSRSPSSRSASSSTSSGRSWSVLEPEHAQHLGEGAGRTRQRLAAAQPAVALAHELEQRRPAPGAC